MTWIKMVVSTIGALLFELLDFDPKMIAVVLILLVVDLTTGIMASRRRGDRITSLRMRQSGVKVLEYALLVITFTVIAQIPGLELAEPGMYIYIALTEGWSILENLYGARAAAVWKRIFDRVTPQQLDNIKQHNEDNDD